MNPIMKLAAVAVGALGIAGGAAIAQTATNSDSNATAMPSTSTSADTPNTLNRTGVSAPAAAGDMSSTDNGATVDSSLTPRSDRN